VQPTNGAVQAINKVQSGLLAQDSLTTGNFGTWFLYGDAVQQHAPYKYSEDSQGLHIGIQAASQGKWVGFYAESPNTAGEVFHAVLTLPYSNTPSNSFNTGLYVQTSTAHINYITCAGEADPTGFFWAVVYTTGSSNSAQKFYTVYYQAGGPGVPLTRDCTIITNGQNLLHVYLDGQLVYSSTSLNLQMPSPFNSYLEVESTYAGGMLFGIYNDYYAATTNNVQVQGAPAGDTAEIVDSSNSVLVSAAVGAGGTANLDTGRFHLPISGNVQVYDSSHNLVASTSGAGPIWGGDAFQLSTASTTTTATSSSTLTTSTTSTATTTTSSTTSTISTSTTSTSTTSSTTTSGIVLNGVQSTSGTVSSTPYQITLANFNAGGGNNRLLVVGVEANNNYAVSVTFGGAQLSKAVQSFYNNDAEFWYLVNPVGTANIVVTMTGATAVVVGAYSFSGVDQANPIPSKASLHNTSPSSPAISLTTLYANSRVIDSPAIWGGATLGSPSCPQQWDVNLPNAITGASSSTVRSSPGSVTCGWTASSADLWDDVAIEVKG
jgi:hypothetical protein